MKPDQTQVEVHYPESDGKPMAETDRHRDELLRLIDVLKQRYRGERVYVSGNLLVYYVEGDSRRHVSPDVFVVKDCDPGERRIFRTWVEDRTPDFVIELTSASTRREDRRDKPALYASLDVGEYVLYDPYGEYLAPPLQAFRLVGGEYVRLEPDADGRVLCKEVDAYLRLEDGVLCLYDRETGNSLPTRAEAELQAVEVKRRKEQASRKAAETRRKKERAAREAAEAEVARLRKLLDER